MTRFADLPDDNPIDADLSEAERQLVATAAGTISTLLARYMADHGVPADEHGFALVQRVFAYAAVGTAFATGLILEKDHGLEVTRQTADLMVRGAESAAAMLNRKRMQ